MRQTIFLLPMSFKYEVGYITTLKNKQKLDVSREGPSSRVSSRELVPRSLLLTLEEGPSLETSSFCLFISGSNITTQHSNFTLVPPTLVQTV